MTSQLKFKSHGGARKGAGRPRKKGSFVRHCRREPVKSAHPMHVTIKLAAGQKNLRTKSAFREFKKAAIAARKFGLRILEFAVLSNHIHMMVEADSNKSLECGMKSLLIRLALNLKVKFLGRYHLEMLRSPTRVIHAIGYILTNAAKHFRRNQVWDWYSSIAVCKTLSGWEQIKPEFKWQRPANVPESFYSEIISLPQSWLGRVLREGAALPF